MSEMAVPGRRSWRRPLGAVVIGVSLVALLVVERSPAAAQRPDETIAVVAATDDQRLGVFLIRGGQQSLIEGVDELAGPRYVIQWL